jgi:protein gp37
MWPQVVCGGPIFPVLRCVESDRREDGIEDRTSYPEESLMPACTKIEWTDMTWNPVTGCSKISPGCKNCYAERLAIRLQAMGNPSYSNGFEVTLHSRLLDSPLHWKSRRKVFVNSMSDLFHEEVPTEFIHKVFSVMEKARQHLFQILTKRSERLLEFSKGLRWPHNV